MKRIDRKSMPRGNLSFLWALGGTPNRGRAGGQCGIRGEASSPDRCANIERHLKVIVPVPWYGKPVEWEQVASLSGGVI